MKVLLINTLNKGGAAVASIRLHLGLIEYQGLDSRLLFKSGESSFVKASYFYEQKYVSKMMMKIKRILYELKLIKALSLADSKRRKLLKVHFKNTEYISFANNEFDITKTDLYQDADIIHLHWVADFLDYISFFKANKKPVVWTLHDMSPFTGLLHYEKLLTGLSGNGNVIERKISIKEAKLIQAEKMKKETAFRNAINLHVVAPSLWLLNKSKTSTLLNRFPHYLIMNGIDARVFKFRPQVYARDVLGIPSDKIVILFIAQSIANKRKGFDLLLSAIEQINDSRILVCSVGSTNVEYDKINMLHLGSINDERLMSLAYAAADVFVIPSLEDNLPNTMLESLMCGTPVIGFKVGGIAEVVENGVNGLLAEEISVNNLAAEIKKFLDGSFSFDSRVIAQNAYHKFNLARQSEEYTKLYRSILFKHS